MKFTKPIAFVEHGKYVYHIYVYRDPQKEIIDCLVTQVIPNDYTGTGLENLFPAFEEIYYQSQFSTNHYHEIRVVDAVVELCFKQFISSPSCEGTGTKFNDSWVFFSPYLSRIVAHIRPETGTTYATDTTFEEERRKVPDLLIVLDSVAQDFIMNEIAFF